MGFFNPEIEDMLEVFQTETLDFMDRMESYIIAEEKKKSLSEDALQGIFRIVHTMKSSSAMMGLEAMSRCSHRLEDLFLLYRDTPEKVVGMEAQVFDLLYDYVDYVCGETKKMDDPSYQPVEAETLMTKIQQALDRTQGTLEKAADPVSVPSDDRRPEHQQADVHLYQWKIIFVENCQMENVRAYLLMKQIRPICGQLYTNPENLQDKQSASIIRSDGLILYFTTGEAETVREKLMESVHVERIEDQGEELKVSEEKSVEETGMDADKKKAPEEEGKSYNKMGMVAWEKILRLQNLTGELITVANMLEKETEDLGQRGKLEDLILENRQLLNTMEDLVNAISMMPVSGMVNQYTRAIRDICKKEGKEISFQVQGEDLEVDKTLIDTLTTPLLHLIRNAADHGIESRQEREKAGKPAEGKITFSAYSMGENLYFSVSDDGRGLNKEQILDKAEASGILRKPREEYKEEEIDQLIFRAGFTTSHSVTEYSGRGVGLDVVQRVTDLLRGSVYVESHWGEGSTFTVSVPFSLTSINSIQFRSHGNICFIPTKNVEQIYPYSQCMQRIKNVDGKEYFQEEGMLPLIRLREIYGHQRMSEEEMKDAYVIVAKGMKHKLSFVIDEIEGQYTIVEKALPEMIPQEYKKDTGINGCAVTADGTIGFILNIDWIMRAYERGDLV